MRRMSRTERAVVRAFRTGATLDVGSSRDRVVRAEVIRFLLLGGVTADAGTLPVLRLKGAHVTGPLEVEYADVAAPVSLRNCRFDETVSFFGSRLRRLNLEGSTMPGLIASSVILDATLRLTDCRCAGHVGVGNSQITGSLIANGARLDSLDCLSLRVSGDVLAGGGFVCAGELGLVNADIGGRVNLDGATVAALDLRHLTTRELVLLPTVKPSGLVDLGHARVGLLRDDPATWPEAIRLDGLTYEALADHDGDHLADRLRWLRLDPDPHGFRPQAYAQLAQVYRAAGRDDEARTVLLAGERHRRTGLGRTARWWGHLQDLTVGYGYRPVRAAAWLAALLAVGTTVFGLYPPRPAHPVSGPEFVAPIYTLDLILPVIDFGQQSAFHPRGAAVWLAYALIATGLLLVTTVAAAGARRLRRA